MNPNVLGDVSGRTSAEENKVDREKHKLGAEAH